MNEFLKKLKLWKEKGYINLLEIIGFAIFFIFIYCFTFAEKSIDIENKVFNNFCNYAIENKLISVEEYIKKYETDYEKESFKEMYSDKDLCIDMYVRYIREAIK